MFLYYFIQLIAHGQVHMNEQHCKYDRISLRARSHLQILSLTGKNNERSDNQTPDYHPVHFYITIHFLSAAAQS